MHWIPEHNMSYKVFNKLAAKRTIDSPSKFRIVRMSPSCFVYIEPWRFSIVAKIQDLPIVLSGPSSNHMARELLRDVYQYCF